MLAVLHWGAGLVVLAEALNKLERTQWVWRGCTWWARTALVLKVVAWIALSIGAAGAVAGPAVAAPRPQLDDVLVLLGFATLCIRTRVKDEFA